MFTQLKKLFSSYLLWSLVLFGSPMALQPSMITYCAKQVATSTVKIGISEILNSGYHAWVLDELLRAKGLTLTPEQRQIITEHQFKYTSLFRLYSIASLPFCKANKINKDDSLSKKTLIRLKNRVGLSFINLLNVIHVLYPKANLSDAIKAVLAGQPIPEPEFEFNLFNKAIVAYGALSTAGIWLGLK